MSHSVSSTPSGIVDNNPRRLPQSSLTVGERFAARLSCSGFVKSVDHLVHNPGAHFSKRIRGVVAVAESMAPAAAVADQASSPSQETFSVSLFPLHRSKVIHIVRHGQGFHNVAGEIDHANYMSKEFFDAALTDLGWQQAEALHAHVDATGIKAQVELVVVSPLLRTLQTAAGVWGVGGLPDAGDVPLMVDGVGKVPHAAIAAPKGLKFIANEWCREQSGMHPCDQRSSVTLSKARFPTVDFSEVATDEDTWWKDSERESAQQLFFRARKFVRWLLDRPESRIAVVSHSSFIFHLCHLFGSESSAVVRDEIQQGFRNCEMRSVVISDRMASGPRPSSSTDFAGGLHWNDHTKDIPVRQIVTEEEKKEVSHADRLKMADQYATGTKPPPFVKGKL